MSLLGGAAETFEDQGERIFWLPALTLGYLYTLSGAWIDFILAVVALVGGMYLIQVVETVDEESDGTPRDDIIYLSKLANQSRKARIVFISHTLGYALTAIYSVWRLQLYFHHEDLVLVGLAIAYLGIILIIVLNSKTFAGLNPELE